ncbi:VOC family protein [Brucella sp. 458]|uniref:VOC family protein n=1 Tax=Brucella sp. 458 TaxID=2821140 RepID=UPI001AE0DD70|nr:VOC family protein [Brucella sp. 458]QTN99618.1 VOC family protein [Brucella sp. 458]
MKNGGSPFVWYELMTSDANQAQDFYSKVIGWTAKDSGMPGMKYTLFDAPGCTIAGMMALSDLPGEGCMDARPGWLGYIGVANVDAAAEKVMAEGGKILRAADDIPGVGRFAVAADPQGAVFSLYSPKADMEPPADFGSRKVGHPSWHELYARDGEGVFPFYEKVFGWKLSRDFDMGAMGKYKIFSVDGADMGGIMTAPPGAENGWGFYFMVDGVGAAAARIKSLGGTVLAGPMEVPNGEWVIKCCDPQNVSFSLVSAKE